MNAEKIRKDFTVLQRTINKKPIIYFDSACMSLKPVQVVSKINEYYNEYPGCGERGLHKISKRVTEEVDNSRRTAQKFFNAKRESEIIFTRNTTEAINLVANSAEQLGLKRGDVVLGTDKEHNSNLLPWQRLDKKGISHEIVLSDEDNTFNLESFKKKLNKKVKLVAMVHTSNMDGATIPAKEIIRMAHDNGSLVLLDAAQSAPHKELDVRKLDADFLACSGHKMLGPTGTGILYGKQELLEKLNPLIVGGGTVKDSTYRTAEYEKVPERFEAGLQDYAGIIGLAEAFRYLKSVGLPNIERHETMLNRKITEKLNDIGGIRILGPGPESRGGIISFNYEDKDPHEIAMLMDEHSNIMLRSGAHCVHSWFNAHKMKGSVRASLYLYNTEAEAETFIKSLKEVIGILG